MFRSIFIIVIVAALALSGCGKDPTSPDTYLVDFCNDTYQVGDVYYFDFGSAFYEVSSGELNLGYFPAGEYPWIVSRRVLIDSVTTITALVANGTINLNRDYECHTDGNRAWWE